MAGKYPLAVLWSEASIARRRIGALTATEVSSMHSAMGAVMSGKVTPLNKVLRMLRNGN